MINWNKIDKKISVKKIILPFFMVILILLLCIYFYIFHKLIVKNKFVKEIELLAKKNEIPTFSVEKIYLCSSASAIDKTDKKDLSKLDIFQYTDMAIYINNFKNENLNNKNTVKELYIDNIDLKLDYNIGETCLLYTNLLKIGSKEELAKIVQNSIFSSNEQTERIDFNIVTTNEQNNSANYENPTFYADCSNPISLKYINKINREYAIGTDNSAIFDGSILAKAGVKPEDISARIKFKINLINNNDEYFSNWVNFRIPLKDIDKGVSIKSKTTIGKEYNFFATL